MEYRSNICLVHLLSQYLNICLRMILMSNYLYNTLSTEKLALTIKIPHRYITKTKSSKILLNIPRHDLI